MRHRLRLFTGEEQRSATATAVAESDMQVSLGDITYILADAVRTNRAWLRDFEDDRIQISADLYEVLSTYWNMRPGA